MKRLSRLFFVAFLMLASAAVLFANGQAQAPSGSSQTSSSATQPQYTFYMVTHACPSDSFWPPVFNGAEAAAKQLGVDLHIIKLTSAQCGSIPSEVANFQTAVSAHPDGILLTVTSDTAFSSALQQAQSEGIPVIAINTVPNNNDFTQNPYLAYIGQDNFQAGVGAGQEAVKLFALQSSDKVAVVDQEPFNISLTAREKGIAQGLSSVGITPINVNTSDNPSAGASVVAAFITHNPDVKAILTLGPTGTTQVVTAMNQTNTTGQIKVGAFDLDSATLHYIEQGTVDFTVDQQPFLQGAYGVVELYMLNRFGSQPEDFPTGPAYLTKDNVSKLGKLVDLTGF